MSAPLRLVELYEEKQWQRGWFHRELNCCNLGFAAAHHARAAQLEVVIRARLRDDVAIGPWERENPRLRFGVPDAERSYRVRRCRHGIHLNQAPGITCAVCDTRIAEGQPSNFPPAWNDYGPDLEDEGGRP